MTVGSCFLSGAFVRRLASQRAVGTIVVVVILLLLEALGEQVGVVDNLTSRRR